MGAKCFRVDGFRVWGWGLRLKGFRVGGIGVSGWALRVSESELTALGLRVCRAQTETLQTSNPSPS